MDVYISVSLSTRNWHLVLANLKADVERLDRLTTRGITDDQRTEAFVEREELQGVIEQIEDQLRS